MSKYGYLFALTIPLLVVFGFYMGGWWNMTALVFVFLIQPLLDTLGGINTQNIQPNKVEATQADVFFKGLLFSWVAVQIGILLWAVFILSKGGLVQPYEWIGFTMGIALVTGGIGITVAHELGHKKSKLDKFLSKSLLMTVCYMHFYIEHNQGHHRRVATPEDPATSRKNENFYSFWVRSVLGSYISAWQLEIKRLRKNSQKLFSIHNQLIGFHLWPLFFIGILTWIFSYGTGTILWQIPIFLLVQSVIAFTLLEQVNYVEHYGIVRKKNEEGRYERVNPIHSWNASHKLSNYFLFQLQRHSDHHYYASKPYQLLNHYDQSPQLPAGYPTMIIVALVPPLWFWIMNTRLEIWQSSES